MGHPRYLFPLDRPTAREADLLYGDLRATLPGCLIWCCWSRV